MAQVTDWDNINLHICDNDERYKRRLKRERHYIKCLEIDNDSNGSLKTSVKDENISNDYCLEFMGHGCNVGMQKVTGEEKGIGQNFENVEDEDEDADPHLKMFMENLRSDGNSYVLKVDRNDGSSEFLKYEKIFDSDNECDMNWLRKSKGGIMKVKVETRKYLAGVGRRDNVNNGRNLLGNKRRDLVVLGRDNVDNLKEYPRKKKRNSGVMGGDGMENLKLVSAKNRFRVKKRGKVVQSRDNVDDPNMKPQNKCDQKYGKYDSCYEMVISSAKVEGDSLCFVDNGKRLTYEEEDNEHSSDLEILDMDNVLNHKDRNFSPFVVTKVFATSVEEDDSLSMGNPSKNENPQFRKTLMGILRRPYNQEEYEDLLHKVKRRPLKGDAEDSSGVKKVIPSDTYGKSPLDYHTDFKRKLRAARYNRSKRLNLLRGFVYWYEKSCQDGAFKPWLDKSCLAATPSRPALEDYCHCSFSQLGV